MLTCITVNQDELRRLILKALYSDEWLHSRLVLKGGNALALVYDVGERTSLDLDFSIQSDFDNVEYVSKRIKAALTNTFSDFDIIVFDFALSSKPAINDIQWWGGYHAEFKLITRASAENLSMQVTEMRRQSLTVSSNSQRRKYIIEISKFEYIDDKLDKNIDDFSVSVYSPVLLAAEKLRALVQQHPSYTQIPAHSKRSRSRDLYDIWAISEHFAIKLEMHMQTVRAVFDAKKVSLDLLGKLHDLRDLHMASWDDVILSVGHDIEDFYFYFAFVVNIAEELYAQWKKNTP